MSQSPRRVTIGRLLVLLAVLAAVGGIMARKLQPRVSTPGGALSQTPVSSSGRAEQSPPGDRAGTIRLVDLGADRCVPCRAMAPILAELQQQYAGVLRVEFVDVWKNPRAGDPYRIDAIPTQIFFGPEGRELFRHQGFVSKAEILATWRRLGHDLETPRAIPKG
jgi:thioredoxin 1